MSSLEYSRVCTPQDGVKSSYPHASRFNYFFFSGLADELVIG